MNEKERIAVLEADMKTLKTELPNMETRMNDSLSKGLKSIRETIKVGFISATLVMTIVSFVMSLVAFHTSHP